LKRKYSLQTTKRRRHKDVNNIEFRDFVTPLNFFAVFLSDDSIVIKWLQEHGLLLGRMCCMRCDNWDMHLQTRKSSIDGVTWRCNYGHEISITRNSFFENSHISLRDIMLFVYEFLKHQTLWKTSQQTSFCYKSTAINWANFVRDIFCQYINDDVFNVKFNGDIEVDEPRFGRRSKDVNESRNARVSKKILVLENLISRRARNSRTHKARLHD